MPKTLPDLDVSGPLVSDSLGSGALDGPTALQIALRLKALADPVRVRIVSLLLASTDERGVCTCDLAPAVGLGEATVSHHLRQLREAGLVVGTREGPNVWYLARPPALTALCRVLDPQGRP